MDGADAQGSQKEQSADGAQGGADTKGALGADDAQGTPERAFSRGFLDTVRPIVTSHGVRIQVSALKMVEQAMNDHMIHLFRDAQLIASHAKRVTIQLKDIQLARRMHGL